MRLLYGLAVLAVSIVILSISAAAKTVHGRVLDSISHKGISGVTVTARQIGWGKENGYLVWDKVYEYSTTTDSDGNFSLAYSRGGANVHLVFRKEGYHSTKPGYPLQDTYLNYRETPVILLAHD